MLIGKGRPALPCIFRDTAAAPTKCNIGCGSDKFSGS